MLTKTSHVRQQLTDVLLRHLDERLLDAEAAMLADDLDAATRALLMAHAAADDLDAVLHASVVVGP